VYSEYTIWIQSKLPFVNSVRTSPAISNPISPWRSRGTVRRSASTFPHKSAADGRIGAMRAAAKDLDKMIASWGSTEGELMDEYKQIQRSAREKKRSAK